MLGVCRSCLRPRLAPLLTITRSYVPRQRKATLNWWLSFDKHEFAEKKYEAIKADEEVRVRSLQQKVERFRAKEPYIDSATAKEYGVDTVKAAVRPSNWVPPPIRPPSNLPYVVRRSSNGNLPVYSVYRRSGNRRIPLVRIRRVDGDLNELRNELNAVLGLTGISINDVTGMLTMFIEWGKKEDVIRQLEDFLYAKGF